MHEHLRPVRVIRRSYLEAQQHADNFFRLQLQPRMAHMEQTLQSIILWYLYFESDWRPAQAYFVGLLDYGE